MATISYSTAAPSNKSGYVAQPVRENVIKAMKELDYHPSAPARALRNKATQSVGVLVPQLAQPYFGAIAFAVEKHLFSHGYRIYPEFTTVAQPYELMADRATQRLLNRILHPLTKPVSEILPTRVVVRRSTGPAPKHF
jgi:DNA-binding LacI/PurR family transcriptional regulator